MGSLAVHDLTVAPAREGAPVVLAVHGITANGLSWRALADELHRRHGPGAVRVLAPDLRGRAASREASGPYGLAVHAQDLATVAAVFGVRPIVVGHSMGAFVAALAAAYHRGLFSSAVLVDGGLAFPAPPDLDIDAALQAVIGPAMDRLGMRFETPSAHLGFWARHPAVGPLLAGPAASVVRAYLDHDLVPAPDAPGRGMSSCILDAVRADGADVLADATVHAALLRALDQDVHLELVWASRGLLDEPQGLYDETRLAALDLPSSLATHRVEANHYDVILTGEGLATVADVVDRSLGRVLAEGGVTIPPADGGRWVSGSRAVAACAGRAGSPARGRDAASRLRAGRRPGPGAAPRC